MPKSGKVNSKIGRDASSGQFADRASKWAAEHSVTREAARKKLQEMGIVDETGKLTKDYR